MKASTTKIFLSSLIFLLLSSAAKAGVFEIGGSASYRSSHFDIDNYKTSTSLTFTVSYYFWAMSALELSYTNGTDKVRTKIGTDPAYTLITGFNMLGVDLVFTLASREASIQPYIKIGAANIKKEFYREVENNDRQKIAETDGVVPSLGIGIKIKLSNTFSIKLGVDAWISDDESIDEITEETLDYAGRAGVSWMF